MSPKRKDNTQTSDGNKKLKGSSALPPAPAGINADIWVKHRENVQVAVHDPKFSGLAKKDPLGINASGSSGHIAPFDKRHCSQVLAEDAESHVCSELFLDRPVRLRH